MQFPLRPFPTRANGHAHSKKDTEDTSVIHRRAERTSFAQSSAMPQETELRRYHLHFTPLSEREREGVRAEDSWEKYEEAAKNAYAERLQCMEERLERLRALYKLTTIRILPEPLPYSDHGTWILEASPEEIAVFCCYIDQRIASVVGPVDDTGTAATLTRHVTLSPRNLGLERDTPE